MTDPSFAARLEELLALKDVVRAGWVRVGVPDPESVAAHSWGVALLAVLLCPPELDRGRLLVMAVLHDLAELRVGDITPYDGVSREEKHHRERVAMEELLAFRPDLLAIWQEAELRESPEARFLKALDHLDLGLTARRYRERGADVSDLLRAGAAPLAWLDEVTDVAALSAGPPSR